MLDSDLAMLYQVETRTLNQAVKRNIKRFPDNFMFQLTKDEWQNLRSQFVIFKNDIRKYLPYVFTEQGVAMLSSVLKSEKAIQVNIQIMNTFVRMRQLAIEHKDLQEQIVELKNYFIQYAQDNNAEIDRINEAIEAFEVLGTEYKNINKLDYDLYEIKPKGVRAYFRYDTDRRKIIIVGFICLKETQKAPKRYMRQVVRNIEAYKRSINND